MNETAKALEALDRIFNNCEEIELNLPKEEREGYKMLVDIEIIREVLINQTSVITEIEKIKAEIKTNRDEWIKGQDAEWYTYDRCLCIIEKHISELKGDKE